MRKRRKKIDHKRIIVAIGAMTVIFFLLSMVFNRVATLPIRPDGRTEEGFLSSNTALNILLMGLDQPEYGRGECDALVLLTADMEKGSVHFLSIPRDTLVAVEGNAYSKINDTYVVGRHKLVCKAVENLIAAPVDRYALVDLSSLAQLIDAFGGVDYNVERPLHYEDKWAANGGLVIDFNPGWQHFDGKKSTDYLRYRDENDERGRAWRQQHFLREIIKQASFGKVLSNLPDIVKTVNNRMETNLSATEKIRLAYFLSRQPLDTAAASVLAGRPIKVETENYWLPNIKAARLQMAMAMGVAASETFLLAATEGADKYETGLYLAVADMNKAQQLENEAEEEKEIADNERDNEEEEEEPIRKWPPSPILQAVAAADEEERSTKDEAERPFIKIATGNIEKDETLAAINVTVINSSGINGAGARAVSLLRQRGFTVSTPTTGKNRLEHTRIVVADGDVKKFYGMPFTCIIIGGGDAGEAFVNIGADFNL